MQQNYTTNTTQFQKFGIIELTPSSIGRSQASQEKSQLLIAGLQEVAS
ncbi:hypothetical protein F7734_44200 [Scytonema sp. UIC 10036]|nr:hypothetical protein [Scytonema sp. UIC 10036]MUG98929.1 hypothetical protein [Scytonema sp. UIC 10036]